MEKKTTDKLECPECKGKKLSFKNKISEDVAKDFYSIKGVLWHVRCQNQKCKNEFLVKMPVVK